jgi:hypothetical protein
MSSIVYLKSDEDVVDFIEKNRSRAQADAVMGVLMWLTACSMQVEVWKN